MNTLNPQQERAVNHVDGPMLVLAGAGSGKTRVVTHRVVNLLKIGVPSSEIIALTFTNKAAKEMRNRIKGLSDTFILTSTFHSLGARILRESIHHLGYKSDFTIYDEKDSLDLLKSCVKSLGYKEEKGMIKSLKVAISNAKNDLLKPSEIGGDNLSVSNEVLKDIYIAYEQKLKEYNALDFDDLLFLTVKLFRSQNDTLKYYQNRWTFLLIDEYQDTNAAQYYMAKLLAGERNNIFVVGDPDQSIYSWRGANINNILDFENDFENGKIITLEQNYRSTSTILEAANQLIVNNDCRYEKKLWSALGVGEKIGVYIANNEKEEALFVVEKLLKLNKCDAISLNECVIFYRTNALSRTFEDALLQHQVPYIIYGGLSFYQRKEIKDILAFLRVSVASADFLAFARTINLPKRGVGSSSLSKLRDKTADLGIPIFDLVNQIRRDIDIDMKLSKKVKEGIKDYFNRISQIKQLIDNNAPLEEIIREAIDITSYEQVLKEDPESYNDRMENVDALISKAAEWSLEHPDKNLPEFLEELSLISTLDEAPPQDAVKLMTLHNGKGLEFTTAFMVGMEENLFPHINCKDSAELLEEERRLCYVGMTRAKKHLYLTASTYRYMWGNAKVMCSSRFIGEIPGNYLQNLSENAQANNDLDWEEERGFKAGTEVFHKDFGRGIVIKSYNTSLGLTYDVKFLDSHTTRSLVGKYAKFSIYSD